MRGIIITTFWRILILLLCCIAAPGKIQSQEQNLDPLQDSARDLSIETPNGVSGFLAQQILIIDSPGKKGKEFGDTTIFINSQLTLYAALYNNGKYKSEAKVDWFWADTSNTPANPKDTSIYLGTGSSIIFKPTKSDTGFIFVKDLPNAPGDSTGTIKIINFEKLNITPAYSAHVTITQGQHNILVTFRAHNGGSFPSLIQEANLQCIDARSQIITNQYQVHRIDTTTVVRAGETRQFEFLVDVLATADTGLAFIDVQLMTREAFYTHIEPRHRWLVQAPPSLNIDLIDALVKEVFPGQEDIFVVMHVSNKGGASVGDLNASLTFWRNGQEVSSQYECQMSPTNPQIIPGTSSAQINLIVKAKPAASYGTVVINGKIFAQDVNTAIWYSDEGADLPDSWLVTQATFAQVGIISTRIICPNSDASGNGEVNINQNYVVEVAVRNQGTEDVQRIGVSLRSDGRSRSLTSASQLIPILFTNQTDTVLYQFEAQAENLPAVENFMAKIDSATSMGGSKVKFNSAFDSLAQITIRNPATVILKLAAALVETPIRGVFDVTATVNHSPESASFDSTGSLAIKLPQHYALISGNPIQPVKENEPVSWKVRSPATPGAIDTIVVYISQIPHDKNNPEQLAQVSVGSAFIIARVLNTFIDITDVAIIEPEGAKDRTVSTNQLFLIRVKTKSQLVENTYARITPPVNFKVMDNAIKLIAADSVSWWLRAPNLKSDRAEPIVIQAWGAVEQDTAKLFSRPDSSLAIVTVSSANLKVIATIIDPPSAAQGRISPGLSFTIQGAILNSGEAGVFGKQSLLIDVKDRNSFRVIGDTLLSVEHQPAIWTVRASEKLDAIPKIIKVWIHDIPNDENNSDEEAFVSNENLVADVAVFTTLINLQLMVRQLSAVAPKAIAPGITEKMMEIEFANLNTERGFPIQIKGLKFDVEDKIGNLIDPQSVIAGFRLRSDESIIDGATSIVQNPIAVSFTNPIRLDAGEKQQLVIELDCHANLSQTFRLNLKDTSFIAITSLFPLTIVDELKNLKTILNLRSHCPVMIENDLKRSFKNYPNPFGSPERETTHFIYYLAQDGEIELKIYTLIGELVWSCHCSSSDPQGKKGLHQENDIRWDGRNSRGSKVLNGVYIARIKTSYGESALTKIAVIK